MTIKEFIERIQYLRIPEDTDILLSSDEEGNSFLPLAYIAQYAFDGEEVYDYGDAGDDLVEIPEGSKNCVVLWP